MSTIKLNKLSGYEMEQALELLEECYDLLLESGQLELSPPRGLNEFFAKHGQDNNERDRIILCTFAQK